jgi:hypothetical protein
MLYFKALLERGIEGESLVSVTKLPFKPFLILKKLNKLGILQISQEIFKLLGNLEIRYENNRNSSEFLENLKNS